MSAGEGCSASSRVLTIVMNRMVCSLRLTLLVACDSRPLPLSLLAQLGCERFAEILRLKDLPDLDLLTVGEGDALRPFQRLLLRLHLPDPEPGDQLLRFGERTVAYRPLGPSVRDTHTLGARLEPLAGEHDSCFYQLVVELPHLFQLLLGRQDAGLGVLGCLYHYNEAHRRLAF